MSAGMVRLSELSAWLHPPHEWLMGVIEYRGWFDESGDQEDPRHTCASMAGYIGAVESWDRFETEWQGVLDEFQIPYLHMKEFGKPIGPYADLMKDSARDAMLTRSAEVIGVCGLSAFAAVVRTDDLRRFNRETGLQIEAYPLALHHLLGEIALRFSGKMMDLAVDRVARPYAKIDKAFEYMAAHPLHPECHEIAKNFGLAPLQKGLTFRNVRAMQAADFLAWETRKSVHVKDDYFRNLKPDRTQDEWYFDLLLWSIRRQARGEVTVHKPGSTIGEVRNLPIDESQSYDSLSEITPITGSILDYHYMSGQNHLRGGIWSYPTGVEG
jgi:hypothetical protein